jgi:DNA-binding response OmpR family regulator
MAQAPGLDIAITDKNPHVREFLCRELSGLGHTANAISGAIALLEALGGPHPPQVLVLDPEVPGPRLAEVARRLRDRAGEIVVLLHVFEGGEPDAGFDGALVVEKRPDMAGLTTALGVLSRRLARLSGGGAGAEEA